MASEFDVQNVLGGFQSLSRGLEPYAEEERQNKARNRPLTDYEAQLGEQLNAALQRGISPEQFAAHVKLGVPLPDATPQPAQGMPTTSGGLAPTPIPSAMSTNAQTVEQGMQPRRIPQTSMAGPGTGFQPSPVSQLPPQTQPSRGPRTAGDMAALQQAISHAGALGQIGARDTSQDKWERLMATLASKEKVAEGGQTIRREGLDEKKRQFDETLKFKEGELRQRWQEKMAALQNRLSTFNAKTASDWEIKLLQLDQKDLATLRSEASRLLTGFTKVTQDPDVQAGVKKIEAQISHAEEALKQKLTEYRDSRKGGVETSTQTGTTIQTQQGPQRVRMKDGSIWERNPDGSARRVQ